MDFQWWHWAIFGIVLIIAELVIPVFVLVWFGLGALLVALSLLVAPSLDPILQILIWTVGSIVMVVLWLSIFSPKFQKTRIGRSDANVVGEVGMLISDVEPFKKGQVRFQKPMIGADLWECMADEPIKSGERVKVLGVEGSFLKVGKA